MKRAPIVVALLCIVAASCRRSHEDPEAFRWQERLPAGATLHLRNMDGSIEVAPADDSLTHVTGSTRWTQGRGDAVQFLWTRDGNDVYLCAVWGRNGQCDARGYRSTRRRKSLLDLLSLFRRGSDAVAMLAVELPRDIRVDASTVTGGIQIEGAMAGVTATAVNGPISIEGSAGPMTARSTNGSVRASLDSIGDDEPIRLESVNGSVEAELPPYVEGEVRLATTNGRVHTDFDVVTNSRSNRSLRGRIGDSSREILLRTTNGGVTLTKRDDTHDADEDEPEAAAATPAPPSPRQSPRSARPRARAPR